MAAPDFRNDLRKLVDKGKEIGATFKTIGRTELIADYQEWYTRALATVRRLLPDRLVPTCIDKRTFVSVYRNGLLL